MAGTRCWRARESLLCPLIVPSRTDIDRFNAAPWLHISHTARTKTLGAGVPVSAYAPRIYMQISEYQIRLAIGRECGATLEG